MKNTTNYPTTTNTALALTVSQPVFAPYSLHVARNEHEGILYVVNSYVEISINVLYATLSLKTLCCHF